jgi:seryl-tRNA synthetase
VDSLAPTTGLNASGAKKALQELCDSEQIDFKAYGKQTFYLSKQSQYTVPPEDEIKKEEAEISAAKEQLDQLRQEHQELKRAVDTASARQTDAELQAELAALRVETAAMEEKLRASKTGVCKLTVKDVQALEDTVRTRISEWKIRKRATREIVEQIAEASGKRPRDIFNDIGCEEVIFTLTHCRSIFVV